MTRLQTLCVTFAVVALVAGTASAQDCYDYRQTFRVADPYPFTGTVTAMTADGDRALLLRGSNLIFLDIADPGAVAELGAMALGEAPLLVSSDGYLAAVASDNSIMLVDWSDPADATVVHAMPLETGTEALTIQGDRLLVSRGEAGVRLYRWNGDGLLFLGDVDTPGTAQDAVVHAGWLIVADTSALLSVDITDPAAPVIVDTYDDYWVPSDLHDVRRVRSGDGFLAVAAIRWHGGMYGGPSQDLDVMTVDAGGQLALSGAMYYYGPPVFAVVDGLVHVADEQDYEVHELAAFPDVSARCDHAGNAAGLLAAGPATVLHRQTAGEVAVYDVRYPFFLQPDPAYIGAAFHDIVGGSIASGWMVKSESWSSGLAISFQGYLYDLTDPLEPVERYEWSHDWWGTDDDYAIMSVCDSDADRALLYMASMNGGGCRLFDGSGGTMVEAALPYQGLASLAGDRAYQATDLYDQQSGVAYLDLSVPGTVTELGFWNSNVRYGRPLPIDETAVLVSTWDGLQIVDFSSPLMPVERGLLAGVTGTYLGRQGDRIYIGDTQGYHTFSAIDVADLDAPLLVWESPDLGGHVRMLAFDGDLAAVAFGEDMRIYDLGNDLLGPQQVSPSFTTGSYPYGLLWDGQILYTGDLHVFSLNDPAAPVLLGRGANPRSALYRHGDAIVTAAGVFPVQCTLTAVDDGPDPVPTPAALALRVAPNPFNPQTTISYDLPQDGAFSLVLYDLTGRRVRTLHQEVGCAGPGRAVWDGRDAAGRAQASGVYFARLVAGDRRAVTKLVLVR